MKRRSFNLKLKHYYRNIVGTRIKWNEARRLTNNRMHISASFSRYRSPHIGPLSSETKTVGRPPWRFAFEGGGGGDVRMPRESIALEITAFDSIPSFWLSLIYYRSGQRSNCLVTDFGYGHGLYGCAPRVQLHAPYTRMDIYVRFIIRARRVVNRVGYELEFCRCFFDRCSGFDHRQNFINRVANNFPIYIYIYIYIYI